MASIGSERLTSVAVTSPSIKARPRLGFVGPMLGSNAGWVVTQGEILAGLLQSDGYSVAVTSRIPARLPRLADILTSIYAWRNEVDLVVHMVFSGAAFGITDAASALCRSVGLPQVFVLRGGALPEFAAQRPSWVRRVMRRADAIVAPSGFLAHVFTADLGLVEQVTVIPNILDIERYPYRARKRVAPRLLWMRTFHDVYNPMLAVRALADLLVDFPDATLTMAGQDKGLQSRVEQYVAGWDLDDHVRFAGFLDFEAKVREFNAHDIYLNTNRVDNMPVSVLEAAAFGLPVVATEVGGVPYLLDDEVTGLLVPDNNPEAMSSEIQRLVEQPALASRLSTNGRRLAESCGWGVVRDQWEALFRELAHA